jgi:monofunctional biosynthetic peptidoglycan transglycosylase
MPTRTTGKRRAAKGKARSDAGGRSRRRLLLRPLVWLLYLLVGVLLWVAAYRWLNPPGGIYMAAEAIRLGGIEREWRDLDAMAPALPRSVMAAEDARFCDHLGFDFQAIRDAIEERDRGRFRGASTISQQVAKNVFLWHGGGWLRKGLEAGFTLLIEALWPKRRILEVYLNTAEFAEGVFGAEAAARRNFGHGSDALSPDEAARLATVLPNPKALSAARPSDYIQRRARAIRAGAETLRAEGRDGCVP